MLSCTRTISCETLLGARSTYITRRSILRCRGRSLIQPCYDGTTLVQPVDIDIRPLVAEITAAHHLTFQGAVLEEWDDHFRLHVVPAVAKVRVGREFLGVRWPSPYYVNLLYQKSTAVSSVYLVEPLPKVPPIRPLNVHVVIPHVCGTSTCYEGGQRRPNPANISSVLVKSVSPIRTGFFRKKRACVNDSLYSLHDSSKVTVLW